MKSLNADQGGFAYAAITALVSIIIIGISWSLLSPVMSQEVFDYAEDELVADNNFDDLEPTYDLIRWVWDYWPLILIIAVLAFLFLASQSRRGGGGTPY